MGLDWSGSDWVGFEPSAIIGSECIPVDGHWKTMHRSWIRTDPMGWGWIVVQSRIGMDSNSTRKQTCFFDALINVCFVNMMGLG